MADGAPQDSGMAELDKVASRARQRNEQREQVVRGESETPRPMDAEAEAEAAPRKSQGGMDAEQIL